MNPKENNTVNVPLLETQSEDTKKRNVKSEPMPKFRKLSEIKIGDLKFKLPLLILTLSGYASDIYNGTSFISGQYYTKYVSNPSDPNIHSGCILESFTSANDSLPQITETKLNQDISLKSSDPRYEYKCFETDQIYGSLTLVVLFLPGFFSIYDINEHQTSLLEWSPSVYLLPFLYLLYIICFPVVFLVFKVLHIFLHPGNVLEHIATRSDQAKALFEDSPQLALQLYILLCEADRRPRTIQLVAITFTCLNIAIPSVKTYLLRKNILHINTEAKEYWISHVLKNYLLFLLIALFRIFSFSFFICLVRFNVIFVYGAFFVAIRILLNIASVLEESTGKLGVFHQLQGEGTKSLFLNFFSIHDIRRGKSVMLFYMTIWFIFYLVSSITLMVLGSISNSEESQTLFFLPTIEIVTWSELFIIRHRSLLFVIGVVSILFGVFSYLLFIWKIYLKYDEGEEKIRGKGEEKRVTKLICARLEDFQLDDFQLDDFQAPINDEDLKEGKVPEEILRSIWEPYNDRTHFQNIYESETNSKNLKNMTLLVDPWQFAKFANKYLKEDHRIDIKKFKSNEEILEKLMKTFNPANKIALVDDDQADIGKEICFRAKIAIDFLKHLAYAESDLGLAEEKLEKVKKQRDSVEKGESEISDEREKEYDKKLRKEVAAEVARQKQEWEKHLEQKLEKERNKQEKIKQEELKALKLEKQKEKDKQDLINQEKEKKRMEEAAQKKSVHETIDKHIQNGKSIKDIFFGSIIRGALLSVEDVLNRGMDIKTHYTEPPSTQWWTALHLAAANGHDNVVKLLINAGMNVNIQTSAGNTPLRFAAMYGHLSTCKLLLEEFGADMNIKGFDGKTGKEWIKERKDWGQAIKAGYPDKFVLNTSNQHDEIAKFMLEF